MCNTKHWGILFHSFLYLNKADRSNNVDIDKHDAQRDTDRWREKERESAYRWMKRKRQEKGKQYHTYKHIFKQTIAQFFPQMIYAILWISIRQLNNISLNIGADSHSIFTSRCIAIKFIWLTLNQFTHIFCIKFFKYHLKLYCPRDDLHLN